MSSPLFTVPPIPPLPVPSFPLFTPPKIPPIPPIPPSVTNFQSNIMSQIPSNVPPIHAIVGCGDINLQLKAVNSMLTQTRKAVGALTNVSKLQALANKLAMAMSGASNAGGAAAFLAADPAGTLLIAAQVAGVSVLQTLINQIPDPIEEIKLVVPSIEDSLLNAPPFASLNGLPGWDQFKADHPAIGAVEKLAECKSKSQKLS